MLPRAELARQALALESRFAAGEEAGWSGQRPLRRGPGQAARSQGGVDPAKVTPHKLRHTFATELLDEGFTIREVQEALRHADLGTTELYLPVLEPNLRAKIQGRARQLYAGR